MTLNLQLTVNDVQVILAGLGKLPLEASVDTFFKVKGQAEAAMQQSQQPQAAADEASAGGTD